MDRTYICIDLKSYYASVECVHRGLDPLKANLLVADESRSDQTICLAVSPSLKAKGVPGRPRLFEAKQKIREYEAKTRTKVDCIIAVPRMAEYVPCADENSEAYDLRGRYHKLTGICWNVDELYGSILVDNTRISFEDILRIDNADGIFQKDWTTDYPED